MSGYKLSRPCANCPFRTDVAPFLREERCVEIAHSLASGHSFPCHKTTHLDEQDEDLMDGGEYIEMGGEQFCAGAMILMEKIEQPNQQMRIAERVGVYEHGKLDFDSPVFDSFHEFTAHHANKGEAEEEAECCHVCGPNCVAPAGYMMGGTIVPATFDPDDVEWCRECGEPTCCECMNAAGVCEWCTEDA